MWTPRLIFTAHLAQRLLLLALPVVLFWLPMLSGEKVTFIGDTLYYFYPYRWILSQAFQAGYMPFWDETLLLGQAFCASPQANCFYPPSLLYLGIPSFYTAYHVGIVLHLLLGVWFTYAWLQQAQYSTAASTLAAWIWGLGGPTLAMVNRLDKLESLTWWPLALFAVLRMRDRQRGGLTLLVLALSLMILAGGLEVVLMALPMLLGWSLLGRSESQEPSTEAHQGLGIPRALVPAAQPLILLVGGGILALLMTWPQLVLMQELLSTSTRAAGLRVEQALELSLRPSELLGFLSPTLLFDATTWLHVPSPGLSPQPKYFYGIFVGWLPLYLAIIALLHAIMRGERRGERLLSAALVVGAVLFALGRYFPVTQALFEQIPPIRTLRFPEKSLSLVLMALLPLSAGGLEVLRKGLGPHTLFLMATLVVFLSILMLPEVAWRLPAALLSLLIAPDGQPTSPSAWLSALWLERTMFARSAAVVFLVVLAFWLAARREAWRPAAAWSAPILLMLELFSVQNVLNPSLPRTQLLTKPELLKNVSSTASAARIHILPLYLGESLELTAPHVSAQQSYEWLRQALYPNLGVLYGLRYADGAQALRFSPHNQALAALRGLSTLEQLEVLPRLGLSMVLTHSKEQEVQLLAVKGTKLSQVGPGDLALWSLPIKPADAYFCTTLQRDVRPSASLSGTAEVMNAGNLLSWKPEDCLPLRVRQQEGGRKKWVEATTAADAGWVILPISHIPGWQAWVDQQATPVETVNGFQIAVRVGKGWEQVELRFPGLAWFHALPSLVAVVSLLWLEGFRFRKLRAPSASISAQSRAGRQA